MVSNSGRPQRAWHGAHGGNMATGKMLCPPRGGRRGTNNTLSLTIEPQEPANSSKIVRDESINLRSLGLAQERKQRTETYTKNHAANITPQPISERKSMGNLLGSTGGYIFVYIASAIVPLNRK